MSDKDNGIIHSTSEGGIAATHPPLSIHPAPVGPTTRKQHNTLRPFIIPLACWRLEDVRFAFDSSFIGPEAKGELKNLSILIDEHTDQKTKQKPPLSIFGHADPVGGDEYNKLLSGRRAMAVYALLTRNTDMWEYLYSSHTVCGGGDTWGLRSIQTMLNKVGPTPCPVDGKMSDETKASIKAFQDKEKLPVTGNPDKPTRKKLFEAYMNWLCTDEKGHSLRLNPKTDFLARGEDPQKKGKGDFQGCSRFNPVRVFSQKENVYYEGAADKTIRDGENAPNRRVMALLFQPGNKVDPTRWPCPRTLEGPAGCRKRFWSDGEKRRSYQAKRREYKETKDTFACRFYDRLANTSPCEAGPLFLRVHLKLMYLDPARQPHVFPPDFPVVVSFADGTTQQEKVKDDGRLTFYADRAKKAFTLRFKLSGVHYIASATPATKGPGPERLVSEGEVLEAIADDYRVFSLPLKEWSLADSDWKMGKTPVRELGPLDSPSTIIGSEVAPAILTLDPQWQYLKFLYFDRNLKKKLSIPPIVIEGFRNAAEASGTPDTRSNWTTQEGCQCLPWILQKNTEGKDEPKPDKNVLLQFRKPKNTFIESIEGGFRRLVSGIAHDTPNADRLRFYDLPEVWKSRKYFARLSGGANAPAAKEGLFEDLAAERTTDAKPLLFSLDDIVLTDGTLEPIGPINWKPTALDGRVAIFSNTFTFNEGSFARVGPYKPDDGNHQSYYTQMPQVEKDRNYIADYPDWTRLVIMGGNLFDVFDERTPDVDGQVVGARAAVRWVDVTRPLPGSVWIWVPDPPPPDKKKAVHPPDNKPVPGTAISPRPSATKTSPFCVVEPFFEQEHSNGGIGRFDMALLRCCDKNGDEEVAVNFQYYRFNFNFSPKEDPDYPSKPTDLKEPAKQEEYMNTLVRNVPNRWNAVDGYNPFPALVVPEDSAAHRLRVRVLWFAQALPKPELAHFELGVFKEVRDHMSPYDGTGSLEEASKQANPKNGVFVAAHETGHAGSLDDEYVESSTTASYYQPGIINNGAPGGPFDPDGEAMMKGNINVRTRYFWHVAEWLRALYNFDFKVRHGYHEFKLPHHIVIRPLRTHLNWPLEEKKDAESGERGKFNIFLYALGDDYYSRTVLPHGPFDGILVVTVKMKFKFHDDDHITIWNGVSKIHASVQRVFNKKWYVTGTAGTVTFNRCLLYFSPRFLVETFSGDDDYKKAMNVKDEHEYEDAVKKILGRAGGVHFEVKTQDAGVPRWDPADRRHLIFTLDDNTPASFPHFFGHMVGVASLKEDVAESYKPIVQKVIPDGEVHKLF